MSDKSPRQAMTKKSTKSLKEKRREKHATDSSSGVDKITPQAGKGSRAR